MASSVEEGSTAVAGAEGCVVWVGVVVWVGPVVLGRHGEKGGAERKSRVLWMSPGDEGAKGDMRPGQPPSLPTGALRVIVAVEETEMAQVRFDWVRLLAP